jgi:hypothetical protein
MAERSYTIAELKELFLSLGNTTGGQFTERYFEKFSEALNANQHRIASVKYSTKLVPEADGSVTLDSPVLQQWLRTIQTQAALLAISSFLQTLEKLKATSQG